MTRTTVGHLQHLVAQINRATNSPMESWTKQADGKLKANIGNYHLSGAYGGYALHRIQNDEGSVTAPVGGGHMPKRDLYNSMRAYLDGINAANESKVA